MSAAGGSIQTIEIIGTIGTWLGPLVTVIGFYFVVVQLRRERQVLESSSRENIYAMGSQVLNMFVTHPELRPYFYDGVPPPAVEPLRSRLLAAVEVFCDHLENIVLSREVIDDRTFEVWRQYMQRIYLSSPALRDFLRPENEGCRYSSDFLKTIVTQATVAVAAEPAG